MAPLSPKSPEHRSSKSPRIRLSAPDLASHGTLDSKASSFELPKPLQSITSTSTTTSQVKHEDFDWRRAHKTNTERGRLYKPDAERERFQKAVAELGKHHQGDVVRGRPPGDARSHYILPSDNRHTMSERRGRTVKDSSTGLFPQSTKSDSSQLPKDLTLPSSDPSLFLIKHESPRSRSLPVFTAEGEIDLLGEGLLWESHGLHHQRSRTSSGHRHAWREARLFTVNEEHLDPDEEDQETEPTIGHTDANDGETEQTVDHSDANDDEETDLLLRRTHWLWEMAKRYPIRNEEDLMKVRRVEEHCRSIIANYAVTR